MSWAAISVLAFSLWHSAFLLSSIRNDPNGGGVHYTIVTGHLALLSVGRLFLPKNISWFGLYERLLVGECGELARNKQAVAAFSLSIRRNQIDYAFYYAGNINELDLFSNNLFLL